ncbi:Aste57867_3163 [Aphanomyces stellatus]|uniref:Aste57867_3163 protein n=1 Tax=Aphanomyces stellatus TaxID=120398 RepID=A0A485KA55_9STRA|nr:hypothetical protein As57867_003154 [Aphanomyces stellatus]VFT80337.1 Aste57867_3163 [Aphanomyces stellatus]
MEFVPLDAESVAAVRRLNSAALPIPVQDHVYRDAMTPPVHSCVVTKAGKVIAAILLHEDDDTVMCIRTIAVDIGQRGQGIGRTLIEKAIEVASSTKRTLYLHVQVDNADAIRVYSAMGFNVRERLSNYYRRLACPDCFVMTRDPSSTT